MEKINARISAVKIINPITNQLEIPADLSLLNSIDKLIGRAKKSYFLWSYKKMVKQAEMIKDVAITLCRQRIKA